MKPNNVRTIINATLHPFHLMVNKNHLFFFAHMPLQFSWLFSWHRIPAPVVVKQFQIATPTLAYSYCYTTGAPPLHSSISLPFPRRSSDPISQWSHQKLIPISALDGGPQQCVARLNSAVNSQPFPQRPAHSSELPTPTLPRLHCCLF